MMSGASEPFDPLGLGHIDGDSGRTMMQSLLGLRWQTEESTPPQGAARLELMPARRDKPSGVRLDNCQTLQQRDARSVCIDTIPDDWAAFATSLQRTESKRYFRRCVDVICSCIVAAATAPVLLLVALAIHIEDRGAVLYRQERIGLGGHPFTLLKFRSMREDAERDGVPVCAAEQDPRVTRTGRIIRLLRIDELPQLLNVLRGEMSMIGPRPERPYFVDTYSRLIPAYQYRHAVRPGITGWAQVSFRYGTSAEDAKQKLSYDLYYVKNRSLFLDTVIVLKTLGVMLRGSGAR
jgi:exopolysaccharide biosynthesis polyprenyl glycosylphosphotransferase